MYIDDTHIYMYHQANGQCQNFLQIITINPKWYLKSVHFTLFSVTEHCHVANCPILLSFISCLYNRINLCCNPLKSSSLAITHMSTTLYFLSQPIIWPSHLPTLLQLASVHTEIINQSPCWIVYAAFTLLCLYLPKPRGFLPCCQM